MSVNVTDNTAAFESSIETKLPIFLRFMLDAIDRISTPNTPQDVGDLRKNKLKQVLGLHATIQWRQEYAAAQEDRQFRNYTTPGTGPHYAENAVKQVVGEAEPLWKRAGL